MGHSTKGKAYFSCQTIEAGRFTPPQPEMTIHHGHLRLQLWKCHLLTPNENFSHGQLGTSDLGLGYYNVKGNLEPHG